MSATRPRHAADAVDPAGASADVLGVADVAEALPALLDLADGLRAAAEAGDPLPGRPRRSGVLLFAQPSTRTRVSFEVGMGKLGMTPVALDAESSQLSRGESLEDTAKVLGRYGDVLVGRTPDHGDLETLAAHASVPVVNALTDREHPCQALADLQTLRGAWGGLEGRTLAYVGDGNNVCHSLVLAAASAGVAVRVASPHGYGPDREVLAAADDLAPAGVPAPEVLRDPEAAVEGADAVYTDVWTSMHAEGEEDGDRLEAFERYTVDGDLMATAPDASFLHCLPAHYGEEVTREVARGPRSLVLEQAENRLWTSMALLLHLTEPRGHQ